MNSRIAIIGGGIAGVTAAWQLARLGAPNVTLYESSARLGGTVETVCRDGFTIECGPDGWVTEKPWARELAVDLGLGEELLYSLDAGRVTWLLNGGKLVAMPDGMRMMVPGDLAALEASPLFSAEARRAYAAEPGRADELRRLAPDHDESVADFVRRHFGEEVRAKVGAPLLSGVFGGDVARLSVRAVMPRFVAMERAHGSLITALQQLTARSNPLPIFTSLRAGTGSLIDAMQREIPHEWLRLSTPVHAITQSAGGWTVTPADGNAEAADAVLLTVPAHEAQRLLAPVSAGIAELVATEASSAVIVAFAFNETFALPRGFGFLVPEGEPNQLLAATFVDQKFPGRVPAGGRLLRAFFGGATGPAIASQPDAEIVRLAFRELEAILGPLPQPTFHVLRRWPRSLPQYAVGHLERMAALDVLVTGLPGLTLLGNAYRGVGLPDLIRDAREAARLLIG